MIDISKIDPSQNEFSEEELDTMIEILKKADEIQSDSALFSIIRKRMKDQVKAITSLEDLNTRYNEKVLEQE